jgi:inosine/xanthosine triphosphate pyrophosphatase family protein
MSNDIIVFVTGNANKLGEVRAILSTGTPIELESQKHDREPFCFTLRVPPTRYRILLTFISPRDTRYNAGGGARKM